MGPLHPADRLSPKDRRGLIAELLARRLMELAAKGLLSAKDEPEDDNVEEVADGPR